MSSTNEDTPPKQIEGTQEFQDVQYLEKTINENGEEKYKLCNNGFIPEDIKDPRYCLVKGFNQKIFNLLASLAEPLENEE